MKAENGNFRFHRFRFHPCPSTRLASESFLNSLNQSFSIRFRGQKQWNHCETFNFVSFTGGDKWLICHPRFVKNS
jgi:hypothetical protein